MQNEWHPIPHYNDYYSINLNGDVLNVKRKRRIASYTTPMGYIAYRLCKEGVHKWHFLHSLLLETFIGPRPYKYQCAHLDGNKLNNKLSNLKWVTVKENHYHKKLHGTEGIGSKNPSAKLTENQVLLIRSLKKTKRKDIFNIAGHFKVSPGTIYSIIKRKTWTHI